MQTLCLITLLALGQATSGLPQDRANYHASGDPLGSFGSAARTEAANTGSNLSAQSVSSDGNYVAPAAAPSSTSLPVTPAPPNEQLTSPREPLPLSRQGHTSTEGTSSGRSPPSLSGTIVNIISSLAIVLGLFYLVVWFIRRSAGGAGGALPSEVVQVLGRSQLSPKQQLQLIRVGGKLVLVAVSATGVQTLTEVTNPDEVERLATACEAARGGSATDSFRQVLTQLGNQPAVGGFFGNTQTNQRPRSGRTSRQEETRA